MAGHRKKPGGLVPRAAPATDLTAPQGLEALSGERMVDVARRTLDASDRMLGTWDELEPIAKTLVGMVRDYVAQKKADIADGAKLLGQVANVSAKIATAATQVMRASEGQTRLALLVAGPGATRRPASEQSQAELLSAMVAIFKRAWTETGVCPTCHATQPLVVATGNGAAAPEGGA